MALIKDGLVSEAPHPGGFGGVQRIHRWGQHGASVVNSPMLHIRSFAWEVAVIKFDDEGEFEVDYSTPLTSDVEVFSTDEETNEFLQKIAKLEEAV